jgi:hypothetical protein
MVHGNTVNTTAGNGTSYNGVRSRFYKSKTADTFNSECMKFNFSYLKLVCIGDTTPDQFALWRNVYVLHTHFRDLCALQFTLTYSSSSTPSSLSSILKEKEYQT